MKKVKDIQAVSYKVIAQLTLAGLVIGAVVGVVDMIFGRVLLALTSFRESYSIYLIPLLAFSGLLIVFLYQYFCPKAGRGMGLVFGVGHEEEDSIPLPLIPLVTVTTWLTHLFGGSAGREGVAVQLGATFSNWFSRYFTMEKSSQIFLVTGMAAGFAGLFQTPIAALFFALEVLVIGRLSLTALFPALVASFVASGTSSTLGLEKFSHLVETNLDITPVLFIKLAIIGLIFGAVGSSFAKLLALGKEKASAWIANPYYRIFLGGLAVSFLLILMYQGRYAGLGTNLINIAFENQSIYSYDWLLKLLFTVVTLSIGFQGGEVTPLFAIGASLGIVLSKLFGLPTELIAAAGYISVFGSATNTLLAPIFIGGEVFGFANLPYFVIVVAFAYLVDRKDTIYGVQAILAD